MIESSNSTLKKTVISAIENIDLPPSSINLKILESNEDDPVHGKIRLERKDNSFDFPFVFFEEVTRSHLKYLRHLKRDVEKNYVTIFQFASQSIKLKMREAEMNYIEGSGRIFMQNEKLLIYIDNPYTKKNTSAKTNPAFGKKGLKLIYHFLENEDYLSLPYRELSNVSGVSLDTIRRVIHGLEEDGFIVKYDTQEIDFIKEESLFIKWVKEFNKTLRNKLKKRSFRFRHGQSISSLLELDFDGSIGGSLAASTKLESISAKNATIYVDGSFDNLASTLDLIPDKSGPIEMIEKFWKEKSSAKKSFVGLHLIYSDLVSSENTNDKETANSIFKNFIRK